MTNFGFLLNIGLYSQNLENLPHRLTICWQNCMVISVYLARKFSSGLRSLRRVGNTSGTIQNRAILSLRKLKRMWRRSLEFFEETADWAFEQFLKLPTSIRKVLDRFCTKIWAWKGMCWSGAKNPYPRAKGTSSELLCWHSWKQWKWSWFLPKRNYVWRNLDFSIRSRD